MFESIFDKSFALEGGAIYTNSVPLRILIQRDNENNHLMLSIFVDNALRKQKIATNEDEQFELIAFLITSRPEEADRSLYKIWLEKIDFCNSFKQPNSCLDNSLSYFFLENITFRSSVFKCFDIKKASLGGVEWKSRLITARLPLDLDDIYPSSLVENCPDALTFNKGRSETTQVPGELC